MNGYRLVLWRHGQTDWNRQRRFQGHSNVDLDEVGQQQAEVAAQALAQTAPDAIVTSDLARAQQTAAAREAQQRTSRADQAGHPVRGFRRGRDPDWGAAEQDGRTWA